MDDAWVFLTCEGAQVAQSTRSEEIQLLSLRSFKETNLVREEQMVQDILKDTPKSVFYYSFNSFVIKKYLFKKIQIIYVYSI